MASSFDSFGFIDQYNLEAFHFAWFMHNLFMHLFHEFIKFMILVKLK